MLKIFQMIYIYIGPICKKKVINVKENATINNMAENYLNQYPEKKKSNEEIKKMDEINSKIEYKKFEYFLIILEINMRLTANQKMMMVTISIMQKIINHE